MNTELNINKFEIKLKLFSKIDMEQIVNILNLGYGASNNDYVIEHNKTGKYTIFLDYREIGRGIEISIEKRKINIILLFPATVRDIELSYYIIEKLCNYLKINSFYKNNKKYNLGDILNLKEEDIEQVKKILNDIYRKISLGIEDKICLLCAVHPVYIGKDEAYEIEDSIENFAVFLDKMQNNPNIVVSSKKVFKRKDDTYFAVYFVYENEETLIVSNPTKFGLNLEYTDIYIGIPDNNLVKYKDFLNNVEYEKYDGSYVKVKLDNKTIEKLLDGHIVDATTNTIIDKKDTIYLGSSLDWGVNHELKVLSKNLITDKMNGYNHLAVFLRYAHEHNWLDDKMYELIPNLSLSFEENIDLRYLFTTNVYVDGSVKLYMFKEEYRDFIYNYYSQKHQLYQTDVDAYALKILVKEKYHCEEYKDEAYLFMEYNEEYYKGLSKYIDKAYKAYKEDKKEKEKNEDKEEKEKNEDKEEKE